MNDDATKKLIFARRARFVAAAIAAMSPACGKEAGTKADAKVDAGARAVDAGGEAGVAKPHACLCVCEPGDPLCSCL